MKTTTAPAAEITVVAARATSLLLLALTWLGAGGAQAAAVPVGPEFQVNSYTVAEQSRVDVTVVPGGDFVLVWDSPQDGDLPGVFGQRVDGSGVFQGVEFQINTTTSSNQSSASVASDGDGDFLVAWSSIQDGNGNGIFGQLFDSAGAAVGVEFQINAFTTGSQLGPAVAMAAGGGFIVAWQSAGQDGDGNGIFARGFNSSGAAITGELQLNTYTTGSQQIPAIALRGGEVVVVWSDFTGHDGDGLGAFGQRLAVGGGLIGGEFQVATRTAGTQVYPSVAAIADGEFVVVWQGAGTQLSYLEIFGQRYDSSGAPSGGEFLVNASTGDINDKFNPDVTSSGDGDFTVVWESYADDGDLLGVFGRQWSSLGTPLAAEFQVNTYTTGFQFGARVSISNAGRFVVAWHSTGQDGDAYGLFAQRFAPADRDALPHQDADPHTNTDSHANADEHPDTDPHADRDGDA